MISWPVRSYYLYAFAKNHAEMSVRSHLFVYDCIEYFTISSFVAGHLAGCPRTEHRLCISGECRRIVFSWATIVYTHFFLLASSTAEKLGRPGNLLSVWSFTVFSFSPLFSNYSQDVTLLCVWIHSPIRSRCALFSVSFVRRKTDGLSEDSYHCLYEQ